MDKDENEEHPNSAYRAAKKEIHQSKGKSEILKCGLSLAKLNLDVYEAMTTKIHDMVDLIDQVMQYVGYDAIYLEDIIDMMYFIEKMTFLRVNTVLQGVPTLNTMGYIGGLPDHWYGTVNNGYIHIVTDYGSEEISIDISIESGSALIGRTSQRVVKRISVLVLSVTNSDQGVPCIDLYTPPANSATVGKICTRHTKQVFNAVHRICAGVTNVYMRFRNSRYTYQVHVYKKDLEIFDTTFTMLDNTPVIIFTVNSEGLDNEEVEEVYSHTWRR
jgi:hypothetical protein